jgi:hypothetical protein
MKLTYQWNDFGPKCSCVDSDEYDGAPDAGPQLVGQGDTEAEALADFHEQRLEREAKRDCKRAIDTYKVWDEVLEKLFRREFK